MRIRIRLSAALEVTRSPRRGDAIDEHEHRDNDTLVERAEPHPLGFTREPQQGPDWGDRHERRG